MTFSSIIKKNFNYNFNKYISFYFVNSLIIAMLFMYGSLIFNPTVVGEIGKTSLYETVNMALMGVILFSIIFITYTNISFLKNRGKEFGMYLTLGMTTKDLAKLIFIENLGVMIASLITGILTGALFGRLFYMGLNKILLGTNIKYVLTYKSFLLSIGIFALIFLGNLIFNIIYIRKVSIIDVLKSSNKKEIGKTNLLLGFISLILFIIAAYCLPKTLLKQIFKEQSYMVGIFIGILLLCPYMIIGSSISLVKVLFSKFPKLYNKNLLVLSNLSHRFLGYKNLLYVLSLLIAGAMFFVGYSYAGYNSTREFVNMSNPYEFMFVEDENYNKVNKDNIEEIVDESNGKIQKYNILEYIEVAMFKEEDKGFSFWNGKETIISETNYNKHMGTNINIKPTEAINITVANEKLEYKHPSTILSVINEQKLEEIQNISAENGYVLSKDDLNKIIGNNPKLFIEKENIERKTNVPFANMRNTQSYSLYDAIVLDDKDYDFLKSNLVNNGVKRLHLMNVENGDEVFNKLLDYLRLENELDNSYWNEGSLWGKTSNDERGKIESSRPVYREELIKLQLDSNGIMLFTMMFIGILFIISNGVVLYYKVLLDINEEEERITSLNRIGILQKEIKNIISKELAITFFTPIIIGGGLGLYFLYIMVSNSGMTELLMKKSLLVLCIGTIIQIVFYLISRRKYMKEMNIR